MAVSQVSLLTAAIRRLKMFTELNSDEAVNEIIKGFNVQLTELRDSKKKVTDNGETKKALKALKSKDAKEARLAKKNEALKAKAEASATKAAERLQKAQDAMAAKAKANADKKVKANAKVEALQEVI